MQQGRPVAYFSRILDPRAQRKSIYEKELIAICLAVLKWKHYLLGRRFCVHTDQQSLRYVMHQHEVRANYQKWVNKLMAFDFKIVYKPGASNRVADALSRKEQGEVILNAMWSTSGVDWGELLAEMEAGPVIK